MATCNGSTERIIQRHIGSKMSTEHRGMWENTVRGYTSRNINILSDSQAAIKALDSLQINSKLAWDCHQSLVKQTEHNRFQLVWVPGHMGTDENEVADQSAIEGSSNPLT